MQDIAIRPVDERDDLVALTALVHAAYAPHAESGLKFWGTHQTVRLHVDLQHFFQGLAGVGTLAYGIRVIVKRRAEMTAGDNDEPHLWFYGWRAVAIGAVIVLSSVPLLASALRSLSWFR